MRIKKADLLLLIQESVRSALKEMGMSKPNTSVTLDVFEAGPIRVRGHYYPGRHGTMENPPEYLEFEVQSISLNG